MGWGGGVGGSKRCLRCFFLFYFFCNNYRLGEDRLHATALPAWVVHLFYISVKSSKFKLNKRRETKKIIIKLGTTDSEEGRLQHRSRPSCDGQTPRTGGGPQLWCFNVGPYDGNVVRIPLKVTLSEVCVLAVFLLHLSMWSTLPWSCTPGEDANEDGEKLLRTLPYLIACLIRWTVTL